MAIKQTINLGNRYSEYFKEPILEIGSKIYSNYKQFSPRIIHEDNISYIGIDIEKGNGVDKIVDLSLNNNIIEELGWQEKFNTIHCHCVLEHVLDIFKFSNNISKILKKGGILYITIPFSWKIHRIPVDMWRFTPQSIDYLFPNTATIFYVNDTDGDTIIYGQDRLEIKERVSPKANRLVIFDGDILHTGSSPTKHKTRILINSNFHMRNSPIDFSSVEFTSKGDGLENVI